MEKLQECKAEVDNISKLDDIPIVQSDELKRLFDEGGKQLKDYLNSILLTKVNDEMIVGIDENKNAINNVKTDITNITNKVDNSIAKIYIGESTSEAVTTSPKIVFSKTVPTTSNYGANLPIGSIVFVY